MLNYTTTELAKNVRLAVLRMIYSARASHIGSCYSIIDVLSVLYGKIMNIDPERPDWERRDRFILSKGHAAAAVYAVLAELEFFPKDWLNHYCQDGSKLQGHLTRNNIPGVEVSTGSLGHGLPIACGMALAGKRDNSEYRVFVVLSDGECDEGSNWEAALFASHHKLDNLIAIIDYNKIQAFGRVQDVLDLEPLVDKWHSFGWSTSEIDGHDHDTISKELSELSYTSAKPHIIIAHTVKGKGVSFFENNLLWHYRSPDDDEFKRANAELNRLR